MRKWLFVSAAAAVLMLLGACASVLHDESAPDEALVATGKASVKGEPQLTAQPLPFPSAGAEETTALASPRTSLISPGTGNFIDQRIATTADSTGSATSTKTASGDTTLNFEGADIRDVAKVIFDTLKTNYTVDPQVQGEVTVQTSRPLTREQLLPTLETVLRMSNAVLVREGGMYRIIPAAGAVQRGNVVPKLRSGGVGYGVRIVPLRYVSAAEMQNIIAPFLPEGGILRADTIRNLLILAGTGQELDNVQSTIDTFDVNWLKGMSIGMFRLRNIDSQAMATNLNQLLGEGSGTPVAGLLRFVPLSRMNAVLVVTPQAEYLKEVAGWIERLDGVGGERLYVYQVQNSRADYVAELLNGLFNLGSSGGQGSRGGDLAPGLRGGQLSSGGFSSGGLDSGSGGLSGSGSGLGSNAPTLSGRSASAGASSPLGAAATGNATAGGAASRAGRGGGVTAGGVSGALSAIGGGGGSGPSAGMEEVRIVADVENNALLIWATNQNYERIISALQRMDIAPRQVLIEATIAEVTLSGQLQYGLQWFFNNDVGSNKGNDFKGTGSLGIGADNLPLNKVLPGSAGAFSYAVTDRAGAVRALLNTLAGDSKIKVLSSPHVMVVDNQQAVILVGDEQPIPAPQSIVGNNVVTTGGVNYKQTGVQLEVLPRVNSGGMVNMEIKQVVSDVGEIDSATGQRAFATRSVTSKVAVMSGQTLVLGGLIKEEHRGSQGGFPVLYKIPVVGPLFGNTTESGRRTELIVLLTPRVVENSQEAEQVTEELKRKMREVAPLVRKNAG